MQRLTDLMINSFKAIGESDSAKYYSLLVKSMYPSIETNIDEKNKKFAQVFDFNKKPNDFGPYVVQIGAFSDKKNANRWKLHVSQIGYEVAINKSDSNGNIFYAVRVKSFKSKKKADEIGKDIKSKLGVSYRVLYRPS